MGLLFPPQSIPVKRSSAAGQYIKGRWIDSFQTAPFNIDATIHPVKGYELKILSEGKRISGAIKLFSDSQLFPADPKTQKTGDIISWSGFDWEIIQTLPWKNGILSHYEMIAIREKEGT